MILFAVPEVDLIRWHTFCSARIRPLTKWHIARPDGITRCGKGEHRQDTQRQNGVRADYPGICRSCLYSLERQ